MALNLRKKKKYYLVPIISTKSISQTIFIFSGKPWIRKRHCMKISFLKVILIQKCDLNSEIIESAMDGFCKTHHLQNLVKDPTCFKNPAKPSCMDLILLTNFLKSFVKSQTSETDLLDFHKSILYCKI